MGAWAETWMLETEDAGQRYTAAHFGLVTVEEHCIAPSRPT